MNLIVRRQFLFLLLIVCLHLEVNAQKKLFLRVYTTVSSNVIKGFYAGQTDSALIIFTHQQPDTISYSTIQKIRTKRRTGHHILLSTVIGAIAGTATGLITHKEVPPSDPNCMICEVIDRAYRTTQIEDAVGGGILGAAAGAGAGTIIGLTRKRETLIVAGNYENWKVTKTRLETSPVYIPNGSNK